MNERRKAILMQNLEKAHQARREHGQLRAELREGQTDIYDLLKGNDDRWEPMIENMQVQKVLRLIPGIKTARMMDVLFATDTAATSRLGSLTWQRREKLAQAVRDVLEVNV